VIVVDTGVIVAAANRTDRWHQQCAELLTTARGPLLLPEALLTEVGYMLCARGGARAEVSFLQDVADGIYDVVSLGDVGKRRVAELVEAYADLPLGTADACVIATAETYRTEKVATVDRKHFTIVRARYVGALDLLPAE
jgi:hypothetical protein